MAQVSTPSLLSLTSKIADEKLQTDRYHSDLIRDSPHSALEVVPGQPPLAYPEKQNTPYDSQLWTAPAQNPKTICGIRRITFILLIIIVVLILVGAVGGGVGGSIAVQNARNSASNSASNSVSNSVFVAPL